MERKVEKRESLWMEEKGKREKNRKMVKGEELRWNEKKRESLWGGRKGKEREGLEDG